MIDKDFRDIDSLWRLVDPLTIPQAAALIAGVEPNTVVFESDEAKYFLDPETGTTDSVGITRVNVAFQGMVSAINGGKLNASLYHNSRPIGHEDYQQLKFLVESSQYSRPTAELLAQEDEIFEDGFFKKRNPNWSKTTVKFDDVVAWLASRGIADGFFFPVEEAPRDYLDSTHPRYSAKLAAAIKVWEAMEDENLLAGKSTKTAMTDWLESRYKDLGLVHNSKISKNAIENVVAVVNWQTTGGAPKTPE